MYICMYKMGDGCIILCSAEQGMQDLRMDLVVSNLDNLPWLPGKL